MSWLRLRSEILDQPCRFVEKREKEAADQGKNLAQKWGFGVTMRDYKK
jgi:hypothetical protein